MSTENTTEPLGEDDIAALAELFELLARFDYEDKMKEEGEVDKSA
jgi:hypothetical protein